MRKLIAFDVNGVLLVKGSFSNMIMPLLPKKLEYKYVKEQYNKFTVGSITREDFWASVVDGDFEEIEKKFFDMFVLDPDYEELLNLKEKYQFAILSNMPAIWADYVFDKFGFREHFDPIIVSGFVHARKPLKEIYEALQKKAGIPFSEMMFVDDQKKNLKIASELGMKTVWFKRVDQEFDYEPDYTIKTLKDLNDILD